MFVVIITEEELNPEIESCESDLLSRHPYATLDAAKKAIDVSVKTIVAEACDMLTNASTEGELQEFEEECVSRTENLDGSCVTLEILHFAHGTTCAGGEIKRILPQTNEPIACQYIKNKSARFCNRVRNSGWLTPTANQLVQTHMEKKRFVPYVKMSKRQRRAEDQKKRRTWGEVNPVSRVVPKKKDHIADVSKTVEEDKE